MNRRHFLHSAGTAAACLSLSQPETLLAAPQPWRTFEITTRVEILKPAGATRIWLPAGLLTETVFQKTLANEFRAEGGSARLVSSAKDSLGVVCAEFPSGARPGLTLITRVTTRDHHVDLTASGKAPEPNSVDLEYFLRPTKLLPTDGIVRDTANEITRGAKTDRDKARAIYKWIVENTFRDPRTRGCGNGDIRFMLESRDLGGKCADINSLFVGLARASHLPARDVYGIRIAKSDRGYKSLGAATENITKSQHCRAEVWLTGYGWTPVDPADVRKVALEEPPGNRPLEDEKVKAARERLFGSWEMNWMAYNFGHDVELPGSTGKPVGFLMYPQAETADGRLDCLNPENFRYQITSRELVPSAAAE